MNVIHMTIFCAFFQYIILNVSIPIRVFLSIETNKITDLLSRIKTFSRLITTTKGKCFHRKLMMANASDHVKAFLLKLW